MPSRAEPREAASSSGGGARASWLGRHELGSILSVLGLTGGVWVFVEVADEVMDGDARAFDRWLLLALRSPGDPTSPRGPPRLEEIARDLTALGGAAVLSLLSAAVIAHLVLRRKPKAAGFVPASVLGAVVLSLALKGELDRPRPDLVPRLAHVGTSSFPSGHTMLSAAVYLTLGAIVARLEANSLLKAHALAWAFLITLLVGMSRIYVGVHRPTDVLAGWAAGVAWACTCWLVARALHRRDRVEDGR